MKNRLFIMFLCFSLLLTVAACAPSSVASSPASQPPASSASEPEPTANDEKSDSGSAEKTSLRVLDESYAVRSLVPGANLYGGTNGLAFDNDDKLYVGAVAGVAIFNVDPETGDSTVFMGTPNGGADDIVFGPDGRMYWNAFFLGKVFARDPDGTIVTLAEGLPGANAIDLNDKGELYVTQVFFGDALWKIDTTGNGDNKLIAENLGGLNGFEIGSDGYIYGPLWFKQQVVKVDPATGEIVKVVADGFNTPCAVNFDSKGNLYALDTGTGEIFRINADTGEKTVVAVQDAHLDNLAFDSNDRMFVTNMNYNGVYEVDVHTGKIRTVTEDKLCYPQGISVFTDETGDTLYVADNFAYKVVDGFTGEVQSPHNGSRFVYTSSVSQDGKYVLMSGWSDSWIEIFDRKTGEMTNKITGIPMPTGSYMLTDGSILLLEGVAGRLVRITNQDYATATEIISGLEHPTGLAHAVSGEPVVYVTEYASGKIRKINYETGAEETVGGGLAGPEGIAVGSDGHLFVIDSIAKKLFDIDPATGESKAIAENLPAGLEGASAGGPAASPFESVAVSASGNIYITSPQDNTVYILYKK